MRVKISILLSIATLAVLSLGFFLPDMLSLAQSKGVAANHQQYEMETVRLQAQEKPTALFDVLRLVSNKHIVMNLSDGNTLDKIEAHQAALEALEFILEYVSDFEPQEYTVHKETPKLAFTEEGEAAIIWECEFSTADGNSTIQVSLDDETGKMISFLCFLYEDKEKQTSNTSTSVFLVNDWAKLCMKYYGFESFEVKTKIEGLKHKNDIVFTDSEGKDIVLSCDMYYYSGTTISITEQGAQGYSAISFNSYDLF